MMDDSAVFTRNGLVLQAQFLASYPNGNKLYFLQDRLCLTDSRNREIQSRDCFELFPLCLN